MSFTNETDKNVFEKITGYVIFGLIVAISAVGRILFGVMPVVYAAGISGGLIVSWIIKFFVNKKLCGLPSSEDSHLVYGVYYVFKPKIYEHRNIGADWILAAAWVPAVSWFKV